jgi:hypothetical protein
MKDIQTDKDMLTDTKIYPQIKRYKKLNRQRKRETDGQADGRISKSKWTDRKI